MKPLISFQLYLTQHYPENERNVKELLFHMMFACVFSTVPEVKTDGFTDDKCFHTDRYFHCELMHLVF